MRLTALRRDTLAWCARAAAGDYSGAPVCDQRSHVRTIVWLAEAGLIDTEARPTDAGRALLAG